MKIEKVIPQTDPAELITTLAMMHGIEVDVSELLSRVTLNPGPDIASLLRRRRLALGASYHDMAERCEMTSSQIGRYETGKSAPGLHSILKIAAGYGIAFEIVLMAALKTDDLIKPLAPGAKPLPRNRVRNKV